MLDKSDIKQQIRATYSRGNMLISKFRKCSIDVKCKLFKAFCNNFYGGNLWSSYPKYAFLKLNRAYKRVFRQLFGIQNKEDTSKFMLLYEIDFVEVIFRKLCSSLFFRILSSQNVLISNIVDSQFFYDSTIVQKWLKDIF